MTLAQASEKYGVKSCTIAYRLKNGMPPEKAISALLRTGPNAKASRANSNAPF